MTDGLLFPEPGPRIFNIPLGAPFAETLARGVVARLGRAGLGPEALARVEVIVSTERAIRALRSAFAAASGGVALGPRFRALGALSPPGGDLADPLTPRAAAAPLPPAISGAARFMILARLVRAMLQSDPALGAPATAPALAADLGALLDAAQASGVSLDALETAALEEKVRDHAAHWAVSKQFLDVVRAAWPALLAERGEMDKAARNRAVVARFAEAWAAAPPETPVIIAGSTGSLDTSAWFIELVSRLPQGAVVLPGFDDSLDASSLRALASGRAPEHPQAGLSSLLARLGAKRPAPWESGQEGVAASRQAPPRAAGLAARARLLGHALRPAPVTDAWREAAEPVAAEALEATAGVSLVEAPGPREEAAAIAAALREALETPGKKAALITPDRTLARRVAADLARWGVEADDSGGRPLSLTAPGVFAVLVAEAALSDLAPGPLLALVKHPLAAAGQPRGVHLRAARRFEARVLRALRPGGGEAALRAAIQEAIDADAERAALLDPEDADAAEPHADGAENSAEAPAEPTLMEWFDGVLARLAPLRAALAGVAAAEGELPLDALAAAHRAAADALSQRPSKDPNAEAPVSELFRRAAGEALESFFARFTEAAALFGPIAPGEYLPLFGQLLGGEAVREAYGRHPRVLILGPLEARMQSADLVCLAGLNDGVWPQIPEPDPWISRQMRAALGLPALESRIGLSAHDFQQGAMAPEALLSRTRKADGAPTTPSRWLLRLENLLAGAAPEALAAMRARGAQRLALASGLDTPRPAAPAPRPRPRPPIAARPTRFSATEVETLIRDPYAIYARKVLRLRPLPDFDETPDARDRGALLHTLMERFVRETMDGVPAAAEAAALFDALAAEILAPVAAWPTQHAVWSARAARIRDWFLETERRRRGEGAPAALEAWGELTTPSPLGEARLTAEADRIDRLHGGGYAIYDYKTGAPPSDKQVKAFAKQLPLEAAILEGAGFEAAPPGPAAKLAYLRLAGGARGGEETVLEGNAADEGRAALDGFLRLLGAYANPDQPYLSRTRPQFLVYDGAYDHLARRGEWEDGA